MIRKPPPDATDWYGKLTVEALQGIVRLRMSREIVEKFWMRADDGRRVTVEWGEPDAEGFYDPVFTASDDPDWTLVPRVATADWTGSTRKDATIVRLRTAIQAVLDDAESQHPGGWGPDVTTVAFLRAALAGGDDDE